MRRRGGELNESHHRRKEEGLRDVSSLKDGPIADVVALVSKMNLWGSNIGRNCSVFSILLCVGCVLVGKILFDDEERTCLEISSSQKVLFVCSDCYETNLIIFSLRKDMKCDDAETCFGASILAQFHVQSCNAHSLLVVI
jgi:hypothetical protein